MRSGAARFSWRAMSLALAGILVLVLSGCTGRGGGQLPPDGLFKGAASVGFTFSCEDRGGLNPPTGRLSIELAYADKGTNPIGSSFGIHGVVDTIDPVLESAVCISQNQPPGVNELIFLGRYRLLTSPPAGFPKSCLARDTSTSPLCRFEVIVRDNDANLAPSKGDFYSIKLSTVTSSLITDFPVASVFYARAGVLSSGNLTVN